MTSLPLISTFFIIYHQIWSRLIAIFIISTYILINLFKGADANLLYKVFIDVYVLLYLICNIVYVTWWKSVPIVFHVFCNTIYIFILMLVIVSCFKSVTHSSDIFMLLIQVMLFLVRLFRIRDFLHFSKHKFEYMKMCIRFGIWEVILYTPADCC